MFPWQGDPASSVGAQSSHHPSGGSTSSFQVPQLRWLPSVLQRNQNPGSSSPSTLRPRVSSISHVVDSPAAETPAAETPVEETPGAQSDEPNSGSRPSTRDAAAADTEEQDPDFAPTPQVNASEADGADNTTTSASASTAISRPEDLQDAYGSRIHGKRLTTKEEVSLFKICNRHAATFGERNKLCEWWRTVTEEFTREYGHPYSWHSVRRKVEIVTKQRMKFLAEQKENGGEDLSNPQWREQVDAWIPNWERFEEAERKRIEIRDSRRGRKRKDRSSDVLPWQSTPERWSFSSPAHATNSSTPGTTAASAPAPAPAPPVFQTPPGVKLPAGYDTMFSSQRQPAVQPQPQPQPQTPLAGIRDAALGADQNQSVTSAVLETLSKLNKHLDMAASQQQRTNSSPVVSALTGAAGAAAAGSSSNNNETPTRGTEDTSQQTTTTTENGTSSQQLPASEIAKLKEELKESLKEELKEELRKEFEAELKKDRAQLEEKLDSIQQTQEMILEMLRQEPQ
ncbi:hypothetical protein VTN96DRAFT_3449 [Rasamsonia emersonii]